MFGQSESGKALSKHGMWDSVKRHFPVQEKEMEGGRGLLEDVLQSFGDVDGVASAATFSEPVLCGSEVWFDDGGDADVDEPGVDFVNRGQQ